MADNTPFDPNAFFNQGKSAFVEKDAPPYPAILRVSEMVPNTGQYAKYPVQWHLGYEPLTFKPQGATGLMHEWVDPSNNIKSKSYVVLEGFTKATRGAIQSPADTIPFIGTTFVIQKKTVKFGRNPTEVLVALSIPSLEEVQTMVAEYEAAKAARGANGPAPAAPQQTTTDLDALIDELIGSGAGTDEPTFRKAFLKSGFKSDGRLGSEVIGKTLLDRLVSEGRIERDPETGLYRALAGAAA